MTFIFFFIKTANSGIKGNQVLFPISYVRLQVHRRLKRYRMARFIILTQISCTFLPPLLAPFCMLTLLTPGRDPGGTSSEVLQTSLRTIWWRRTSSTNWDTHIHETHLTLPARGLLFQQERQRVLFGDASDERLPPTSSFVLRLATKTFSLHSSHETVHIFSKCPRTRCILKVSRDWLVGWSGRKVFPLIDDFALSGSNDRGKGNRKKYYRNIFNDDDGLCYLLPYYSYLLYSLNYY